MQFSGKGRQSLHYKMSQKKYNMQVNFFLMLLYVGQSEVDQAKPSHTIEVERRESTKYEEPSYTTAQESEEGDKRESTSEQLLDGVMVVFSDYQDCMDEDTMDKWKQVVVEQGRDKERERARESESERERERVLNFLTISLGC